MPYACYFLDADDTLIDFPVCEEIAFRAVLKNAGLFFSRERFQRYQNINREYWRQRSRGKVTKDHLLVQRFMDFARQEGISLDAKQANTDFLNHLGQQGPTMPGARELVQALHQRAQVVILTNGVAFAQYGKLRHSGLMPFIDYVIISEEIGAEKPLPAIFEAALYRANVTDKSTVLMVGDSPESDIQGAANAGIDSCLYDPFDRYPDVDCTYRIKHLSEVSAL